MTRHRPPQCPNRKTDMPSLCLSPRATREDDVAEMERRDQAVAYLNSPELLMMYAQSTGDVRALAPPPPPPPQNCFSQLSCSNLAPCRASPPHACTS